MEKFKPQEQSSDMELTLFLANHIDKPCEDLDGNNIREFYLREAKRAAETFQDPVAKELLESIIRKYSTKPE